MRTYTIKVYADNDWDWQIAAAGVPAPTALLVLEALLARGYDRDATITVDANPVDMTAEHLDVLVPGEKGSWLVPTPLHPADHQLILRQKELFPDE
jgi:hypothetical protein